ncbi:YihA family ribosome biogenesis GTP-binding protein [Pelagicoccus sp. NFK12]|uniref:Probable GTP-binding protein EngB n=1 Tax=Pelagicoccus enzymogenes TaxID=2773457 RepID=A0A927IJU5_9BACT|nr:ribosome biogenesis GTP-binding protein YihA/YsxC [Pelagicoccus enzymogenes]MBD5782173.1 YihA family ribosome biogenesis GTP-binding protein [Pelagicoccus enzymogenes]MDQ8196926.1 ribosome biogenesis GTP-binding protein YihA/YsxC [Pelagicoccus enzymogenes]
MKIESAEFLTSAKNLEDCPRSSLPEVAFIGRSNVGKSSLVNMLTKQKGLAKVSKKPGATKLLNFFTMNKWWNLVDLPGYGYAQVSKGKQSDFNIAVSEYLMGRPQLKLICALVDARFEPTEIDLGFFNWLEECPVPHVMVFTKTDEVQEDVWRRNMEIYRETLDALGLRSVEMIPCSSVERAGRGVLLQYIQGALPKKPKKGSGTGVQLNWLKKG